MLLKKNSLNFFSVEEDDFSEFNLDSGNNQEEEEKSNTAAGYTASTGNYGSGGSSVGDLFSGTNSQSSTSDVKTEESNLNDGNIGNKVGYQAVEKPGFSEQTRYYEAPGNKAGDIKFKGSIASGQVDAIDIEEGRFASDASYQTKTFGAGEGNQGYKVPLEDRVPISGNGEVGNTISSVAQSENSSASKPNVSTEPATSLDAPSANNEEEHFMAEDVPEEAQGNNESTSEDDGLGYEPFDDETQDSGSTPEAASSQKKNSGGGGGGGGYAGPLQAPPPSNPWDTSNYVFDEASYNPDAVDSVPAEQLYATYSNFCKLQFISEGTVGSLGKVVNIGPNRVSNVSTSEMSRTKRCLQNIGDTMNGISERMGNVVNQTFKFDRDAKSLFRHEGMDIPDDYAEFLKQDAQNYILGLLGIDTSTFAQDLTAGEGDPSAPQIDWRGLAESDPEGCAQKASDIAAEALKKDPSDWTADDVIALQIYHADLVDKVAGAKTAYDEAAIADLYGYESADEYSDYVQLSNENKNLEKVLKANGLMEYTAAEKGWQDLKAAGSALWGEVKDVAGAVKEGNWDEVVDESKDLYRKAYATGSVLKGDVVSGVLKLGEWIDDGRIQLVGAVATPFTKLYDWATDSDATGKMWNGIYSEVARDKVGELRTAFYEDTPIGRQLNEDSLLKYDSAGSKLIQDATIKASEYAAAALITVATGGTAAPLVAAGIGFLEGMGKEGEKQYNITDENGNYTNRNIYGLAKSVEGGFHEGMKWYSVGQATSGLMALKGGLPNISNSIEILKENGKYVINAIKDPQVAKTALINAAKAVVKDPRFWAKEALVGTDAFITKLETGKVNWKTTLTEAGAIVVGEYGNHLFPQLTQAERQAQAQRSWRNSASEGFVVGPCKDADGIIHNGEYAYVTAAEKVKYGYYINNEAWMAASQRYGPSDMATYVASGDRATILAAAHAGKPLYLSTPNITGDISKMEIIDYMLVNGATTATLEDAGNGLWKVIFGG